MMVGAPDEAMMLQVSEISDMPDIINDLDPDFVYDSSEQQELMANAGASRVECSRMRPSTKDGRKDHINSNCVRMVWPPRDQMTFQLVLLRASSSLVH